MNKASKLIAESLLGQDFRTVICGGRVYTIYPPTIKIICRAIPELSKVEINESYTKVSIIPEIPKNIGHIIKATSLLIAGDVKNWRWKAHRISKSLRSATPRELGEIFVSAVDLIQGKDFFDCAALAKNVSQMAATQE